MLVEANQRSVPWNAPIDMTVEEFKEVVRNTEDLNHPAGLMVAFGDTNTRLVTSDTSSEILTALTTASGDDDVGDSE